MAKPRSVSALGALALMLAVPAPAHERDPDDHVLRDAERAAERAEEQAARFAEERLRIEEHFAEDADKAAEDLAKLEADAAEEQAKAAEDAAKREADLAEDLAEEEAKQAEELAKNSEDDEGSSGPGSSAMMRDLGESERAEHDEDGYPVRRGELVGIDLAAATIRSAEATGFRVIERRSLPSLNRELIRLEVPHGLTATEARQRIRAIEPGAVVDMVHYYGLNFAAGAKPLPVKGGGQSPRSGAPLVVGVIDTAVAGHKALGGTRIVPWRDGNLPGAPAEHGTAVASIIAGHGRATIYSANIFRGPAERPFTSAEVIAGALEWMLSKDIPTINMSLAGPRNIILDQLVRDALAKGRSVIAAAGNGGPLAPPAYPAAVPGVIAVTAVDKELNVYRYANRGKYISVAAPGVGVIAAYVRGGMARFTGTSFAAPHIAGWIAHCRSSGGGASSCFARLRASSRDLGATGFDDVYGYGFIT
jgi:subtilisin family serine protease